MEWNKFERGAGLMGVLILLLGFCLVIGGCESDSVVPQEQLPALTEQGAAQQASLVAVGISKAGPELLNFSGKSGDKELGVYPYTFPEGGDISGTIMLEYFTGGAGGTHSPGTTRTTACSTPPRVTRFRWPWIWTAWNRNSG